MEMESLASGTLAGTGSFSCDLCGYVLTMTSEGVLPRCPGCSSDSFTRTSLFGTARFKRMAPAEVDPAGGDALVQDTIAELHEPGRHLVFQDGATVRTMALSADSMRIGRSLSADLRFEDPTVSRRHAVLVREPDGVRVLDDRSLNGVFVNGKRVASQPLRDGDEILIGRYRLRFVDRAPAASAAGTEALRAE